MPINSILRTLENLINVQKLQKMTESDPYLHFDKLLRDVAHI